MTRLIQINTKSNIAGEVGLPKYPVDEVEVTMSGVGDDYNHYRTTEKNSTHDRAVLIYTTDKLQELNDEGWPLKPGDIGENFTIEGLEYDRLEVGDRLQVGEVLLQITEVCNPCSNLSALEYVGKKKIKEFIQTMKGRRGWYCKVIREGRVQKDDSVMLHTQ